MCCRASKLSTWAPMRVRYPSVSKRVTGPMPQAPFLQGGGKVIHIFGDGIDGAPACNNDAI